MHQIQFTSQKVSLINPSRIRTPDDFENDENIVSFPANTHLNLRSIKYSWFCPSSLGEKTYENEICYSSFTKGLHSFVH